MLLEELKNKATSLPQLPGVYIMKDRQDSVIYVGKAKKLKNRVSQYFQNPGAHSVKTRQMVCNVDHFETIIASSEFEALVLECSLIKRYKPKYNILLKDDKGYPFIRLDTKKQYPVFSIVNRVEDDGAEYFGPFGSRGVTKQILEAIHHALKLPTCTKVFPRDIGKERPCLNYHMNQCAGWCQHKMTRKTYLAVIQHARQLLHGHYKQVVSDIRLDMEAAAEELNFELAATLRDRMNAVESLGKRQNLVAGNRPDTDVIGYAQCDELSCFTILHFVNGDLIDKEHQIFQTAETQEETVSALVKQYYLNRGIAPKQILLPFAIDDCALFEELLFKNFHKRTYIKVPKRGTNVRLVERAIQNASEELKLTFDKAKRSGSVIKLLESMLAVPDIHRIESFDISNLAGTDTVASMVVFVDGRAKRSEYKSFRIKQLSTQDDYASMAQVVERRFMHYLQNDKGFDALPDLLLIDGGITHAKTALGVLDALQLTIPVFGMVKDDRHRTRALVTPGGDEIRIDNHQSVFSLIGNIQEETHRFAIGYHKKLRSRRLHRSALDEIPNIGPQRKAQLLKFFKSVSNIRAASLVELEQCLPCNAAEAVFAHFHKTEG